MVTDGCNLKPLSGPNHIHVGEISPWNIPAKQPLWLIYALSHYIRHYTSPLFIPLHPYSCWLNPYEIRIFLVIFPLYRSSIPMFICKIPWNLHVDSIKPYQSLLYNPYESIFIPLFGWRRNSPFVAGDASGGVLHSQAAFEQEGDGKSCWERASPGYDSGFLQPGMYMVYIYLHTWFGRWHLCKFTLS